MTEASINLIIVFLGLGIMGLVIAFTAKPTKHQSKQSKHQADHQKVG